MYYKSANGYNVKCSQSCKIYNLDILELFVDPISSEIFDFPVYLENSNQIYEKSNIIKWFSSPSNSDPITMKSIDIKNINYFSVVNYFLALLCFEKCEEYVIFHSPKGNIVDILYLATLLCDRNFSINEQKLWQVPDTPISYSILYENINSSYISLSLDDYIPKLDRFKNDTNKIFEIQKVNTNNYKKVKSSEYPKNMNHITLEEILIICPLSGKNMYQNCFISNNGLLLHKKVSESLKEEINYDDYDSINTLASMEKLFKNGKKVFNDHIFEFVGENIKVDDFMFYNSSKEKINYEDLKISKEIYLSSVLHNSFKYTIDRCINSFEKENNLILTQRELFDISQENNIKIIARKAILSASEFNTHILRAKISDLIGYEFINNVRKLLYYPSIGYEDFIDLSFLEPNKDITFDYCKVKAIGSIFENIKIINCRGYVVEFFECIFENCQFVNCQFESLSLYSCTINNTRLPENCVKYFK